MSPAFLPVALAVIGLTALALVFVPRPLFVEAGEAPPRRGVEWIQAAILMSAGFFLAATGLGGEAWGRVALSVALMALIAVVYSDLRFLIIPDAYSLILAVLAVISPLSLGLPQALAGAAVCGGLLAGVLLAFKRYTRQDGMGWGDVKLGAALGAMVGMEHGVWAIAGSAGIAAIIGLVMKRLQRLGDGRLPYGAALALAGAVLLIGFRP